MNTLQKFEAKELKKVSQNKQIPEFSPGDTLIVNLKIREGDRERIQAYEGVCIGRAGHSSLNANFTVRKISYGEGVERVFPLYSPSIDSIELVRRGSVRRAKLYYLRDLRGRSARISERTSGHGFEGEGEDMTSQAAAPKADKPKKAAAEKPAAEKAEKAAAKPAAKKKPEGAKKKE